MFKKFIQKIIEAENKEDAINNVFYGADGIDVAYQHEKITRNNDFIITNKENAAHAGFAAPDFCPKLPDFCLKLPDFCPKLPDFCPKLPDFCPRGIKKIGLAA